MALTGHVAHGQPVPRWGTVAGSLLDTDVHGKPTTIGRCDGAIRINTLNVRGAQGKGAERKLRPLLVEGHALCPELHVGDLTFLVEMRGGEGPVRGERLHNKLASETASYWTRHVGLVLSARMLDVEMQVDERQDGRVMHVRFVWDDKPMHVIAVYAPGERSERKDFYTAMWIPDNGETVAVVGDFNTVTCVQSDVRINGDDTNPGGKEWNFLAAVAGLHDTKDLVGAEGSHFTWEGRRAWGTQGNFARRLDRIHVTNDVHVGAWATLPPWGSLDHAVVTCSFVRDMSPPPEETAPRMKESILDARKTSFFEEAERLVANRCREVTLPGVPDERKLETLGEVFTEIQGLYVDHAKAAEKKRHAEVKAARRTARKIAESDRARGDADGASGAPSQPGTPPNEPHDLPRVDEDTASEEAWTQAVPASPPGTPPSAPAESLGTGAKAAAARVHAQVCAAIERLTVEKEDTADAYATDHDTNGDRDFYRRRLRMNTSVEFRRQRVARLEHDEQVRTGGMASLDAGGFCDGSDPTDWTTGPDPPPAMEGDDEGFLYDDDAIRQNTVLYYQWRFRRRRDHRPSLRRVLQYARDAPRFNKYAVRALGADLTVRETRRAIERLKGGRAPGPDGITSECLQGIKSMPKFLCAVFNAAFRLGRMPPSLMQGTVVLLHKKGDRAELDNMRPLTLCQRGYLVLANALTSRLEQFMGQVVLADQTAFVPGRQMHENVTKVMAMLDYTRDSSLPGALVSVDARAAYDCVSHDALFSLLDIACTPKPKGADGGCSSSESDCGASNEVPPTMPERRARFTKWVMLLTCNAERRVLVNGTLSSSFTLEAGVPQGSSLSPALFCVFCNTLGVMMQQHLSGVALPRAPDEPPVCARARGRARASTRRITAVRFADDVNFIVRENEVSLAFDIIECWCQGLGMGMNAAKSEGMWIGSARHRAHPWQSGRGETPGFSVWKGEPRAANAPPPRCQWLRPGASMRVLGVLVGYNVDYEELWRKVGAKMLTAMRLWARVKLSLPARVMVLKTMILSKCWFLSAYCPSSKDTLALMRRAGLLFLHRGFLPRGIHVGTPLSELRVPTAFNFPAVSMDMADGGLGCWDPVLQVDALHAKWIYLLLQPTPTPTGTIASWLHLPRYYVAWHTSRQDCHVRGLGALIDGHRTDLATRLGSVLPAMWQRALKAWVRVRERAVLAAPSLPEHVPSLHLWGNVLINGPRGPLEPPPGWMRAGIHAVRDVWSVQQQRHKTLDEVRAAVAPALQECVQPEDLERVQDCVPAEWTALLCREAETPHQLGEWLQVCVPTAVGGGYMQTVPEQHRRLAGWDLYHVAAVRSDGPVYQHYSWSRSRAEWLTMGQYAPAALHVELMRRVHVHVRKCGAIDHVVGLTHDVWASDVRRLSWEGKPFTTRTVRRAIEPVQPVLSLTAGKVADSMRMRGALEATQCRNDGTEAGTVWQCTVRAVWSAVWAPRVRSEAWRLMSGAAYYASQRRWHDVSTAVCKHCVKLPRVRYDSDHHAYCECPMWDPLWAWAQNALKRAGFQGFTRSTFMVYGALAPSHSHHERYAHELYLSHPVMAIRGAMVAGYARTRAIMNTPPPEGEERPPPPHPVVAAHIAYKVLRRTITLDFKEASKQLVHQLPLARRDMPCEAKRRRPRTHALLPFETKWILFATVKHVHDRGEMRPVLTIDERLKYSRGNAGTPATVHVRGVARGLLGLPTWAQT